MREGGREGERKWEQWWAVWQARLFFSFAPTPSPPFPPPRSLPSYDTRLTPHGERQARQLARSLSLAGSVPPVVLASPLTRALATAVLAFPNHPAIVALPAAAERVWLASDVGRPRAWLEGEFGGVDFGGLPAGETPWWHGGASQIGGIGVTPETDDEFEARIELLRHHLTTRPEPFLALVAHAGVLRGLTGRHFDNCEAVAVTAAELRKGGGRGGAAGFEF